MLAEKLNMTNEEAEKWIVDLIRNARLDAKIDSKLVINLKKNKIQVILLLRLKINYLKNKRVMLFLELKLSVLISK